MNWTDRPDGELLQAFSSQGDAAAFEALVRRHGKMVSVVCWRAAPSSQDAEDVAQAVFTALAERAAALADRPSVAGWLHRTAWHVATRARRAAGVRRRHERAAAVSVNAVVTDTAPRRRASADREAIRVEIHRAINAMPEANREAMILHHLEGLTVRDVAELFDCPVGTVAARLSRGRAMLRERLERRKIGLPAVALGAILGGARLVDRILRRAALDASAPTTTGRERYCIATGGCRRLPVTPSPAVGLVRPFKARGYLSPSLTVDSGGAAALHAANAYCSIQGRRRVYRHVASQLVSRGSKPHAAAIARASHARSFYSPCPIEERKS